ncbi:hypothetical protein L6452_44683 [Arctium lappa]|uniref:Uncharacterized protein n=1 Tax=Arctium lappa TaxID=4217 RepID=A0ACB8XHK4_ARCLA|nr:hypothetical protein L6452_44683 [Arctium lappa]
MMLKRLTEAVFGKGGGQFIQTIKAVSTSTICLHVLWLVMICKSVGCLLQFSLYCHAGCFSKNVNLLNMDDHSVSAASEQKLGEEQVGGANQMQSCDGEAGIQRKRKSNESKKDAGDYECGVVESKYEISNWIHDVAGSRPSPSPYFTSKAKQKQNKAASRVDCVIRNQNTYLKADKLTPNFFTQSKVRSLRTIHYLLTPSSLVVNVNCCSIIAAKISPPSSLIR